MQQRLRTYLNWLHISGQIPPFNINDYYPYNLYIHQFLSIQPTQPIATFGREKFCFYLHTYVAGGDFQLTTARGVHEEYYYRHYLDNGESRRYLYLRVVSTDSSVVEYTYNRHTGDVGCRVVWRRQP